VTVVLRDANGNRIPDEESVIVTAVLLDGKGDETKLPVSKNNDGTFSFVYGVY
jgi:hypothetical protein